MKTSLNFENTDTKKLLSKLDFEFFLKQNIIKEKYKQEDISKIYDSYKLFSEHTKKQAEGNSKQFFYYIEGQVRKMFTGGYLPAHFELDEGRKHTIIDFEAVGENWAYFKFWQNRYKRKVTKELVWDIIVKAGSILAIILSIIKFLEYFN